MALAEVDSGINCAQCSVGRASGLGAGAFCPFIDRNRRAGELLYLQGDTADHVWFVKRGTVVLSRLDRSSETERAHAVRLQGAFIGLEAVVNDRYLDTARAATDVVVCGATRDGIDAWLGPSGTPARTALEITLRTACGPELRHARTSGSAVERVAAWLADEGPRGVTLTLPRRVMAELLGMRPETFSRALGALSELGAIETTRTTLRITDNAALIAAAGQ